MSGKRLRTRDEIAVVLRILVPITIKVALLLVCLVLVISSCKAAPTNESVSYGVQFEKIGSYGSVDIMKFRDGDTTCYFTYRDYDANHSISCLK